MANAKTLGVDFAREKEAGYQRVFARSPQLTSFVAGWRGIYFGYDYMPPGETPEVVAKQHSIAIFTDMSTPRQAERSLDGIFQREQVVEGDIVIAPANIGCRSRWEAPGGVIFFGIEPAVLAHAVYEAINPECIELLPHFATADPLVYQIGLSLKAVLEQDGAASRLYGETMANALIVHLLQHYSAERPVIRSYADGLSRHRLRQVIEYIHEHLDCDLSLVELAAIAQMSPHYFSQLFKQSVRMTPHQYVIRARVESAKELLAQGNLTIAEVAKSVGFVDQSHLHRHLKRLMGVTPKVLQRSKQ